MPYIKLIDINRYEIVNSWALDGIDGVFLKASEANLVDKVFPSYWRALKNTNKVRGTYNYFRPMFDLYTQVFIYAAVARNTPLPPVADVELYNAYSDDVTFYTTASQVKIRATIKAYLDMLEEQFGRTPIVYTSAGFWNKYVGNVDWAKNYKLWVANYDVVRPQIPLGWTEWLFWQYTSHGSVAGITGDVDMDYFSGTLQELKLLANVEPTVPPPPPPPMPRKAIRILVDQLRIRTAPSTTVGKILGYLPKDHDIDYIEDYKTGADVWYRIGYNQWCAGIYNGYRYVEVVL